MQQAKRVPIATPNLIQLQMERLRLDDDTCLAIIDSLQRHRARPAGCGATKCAFHANISLHRQAVAPFVVKFPNPDGLADYRRRHNVAENVMSDSWQGANEYEILGRLVDNSWPTKLLGIFHLVFCCYFHCLYFCRRSN